MQPFVINLAVFGIWSFLFGNRLDPRNGGSPAFMVVVSAQLLVFMAVSPIVSDANYYAWHASLNQYGNWDPGWVVFSRAVWFLWPNPKSLVLATGAAMLVSFSIYVWLNSRNMAMSFLIYICLGFWGMTFFILRQSMAIAVALIAYETLKRGHSILFLIATALAMSFHQTAALLFLMLPLTRFKRDAKYHFVMGALGLLLFFGYPYIVERLNSVFRGVTYEITDLAGMNRLLMYLGILVFSDYFGGKGRQGVPMHGLELSCVLQVLSFHLSVFTRATNYFVISAAVTVPNAINEMEGAAKAAIAIFVTAALIAFYLLTGCAYPADVDAWTITLP